MKKWIRFFCLSFFSDKISSEGARRGYTNVFVGLILSFILLWLGFLGGDMLPFSAHYNNSPGFKETARSVLANQDGDKRIALEIEEGVLKAKNREGEYLLGALVNTFENESDKQNYSVNGYNLVIDLRPADTIAEVLVYCISDDGKDLIITYEEYLSLSEVKRLNFDFKLDYTGKALELTDELIENCILTLHSLSDENKTETEKLRGELLENKITKNEYDRAIYELYFEKYYPEITEYESASKVPLLRNYYYNKYIKEGKGKYLFIFDDYLAGSFETNGGIISTFYGFYNDMENGAIVKGGATQDEAYRAVDKFIGASFNEMLPINAYAYAMNVFALIPFIALMPLAVSILAYSILKLRGIESMTSLGGTFKIIGSYVWFSAAASSALTVIFSFFVQRNMITAMLLVLFFITLAIRSIIFALNEARAYLKRTEQQIQQTEA